MYIYIHKTCGRGVRPPPVASWAAVGLIPRSTTPFPRLQAPKQNPTPSTLNPKPHTPIPNPQLQTRNPKPQTLDQVPAKEAGVEDAQRREGGGVVRAFETAGGAFFGPPAGTRSTWYMFIFVYILYLHICIYLSIYLSIYIHVSPHAVVCSSIQCFIWVVACTLHLNLSIFQPDLGMTWGAHVCKHWVPWGNRYQNSGVLRVRLALKWVSDLELRGRFIRAWRGRGLRCPGQDAFERPPP